VTVDAYAAESIAVGSQSFAAAARLFGAAMRRDATALYAWCRHCDDVVDGQAGGQGRVDRGSTAADRLAALEAATRDALGDGPIRHPAFGALRDVVRRAEIPLALPFDHLAGFRMDIEERRYRSLDDLLGYCYGVAGVVGVMMAHVMGARASGTLDRACDLGLAFQLTNIARDIVDDAAAGRVYLPLDWLTEAGIPPERIADPAFRGPLAGVAARLVAAAEPYYVSAGIGLADLPLRAAWTIGMAKNVYRAIGRKVLQKGASAWNGRVATSRVEKLALAAQGGAEALRSRVGRRPPRPQALWTRPRAA
jgi:15-cis-phytoene synthase